MFVFKKPAEAIDGRLNIASSEDSVVRFVRASFSGNSKPNLHAERAGAYRHRYSALIGEQLVDAAQLAVGRRAEP